MSSAAAETKGKPDVTVLDRFPPMRLGEKVRVVGVCCVLLAVALTLVWKAARPFDPYGAVTIVYHPHPVLAMLGLVVFAAVGSVLATLAMQGRLTDFGVFAVGVGLAGIGLRGGDLTVLLQYEAGTADGRASVFGLLTADVLLWTILPAVSLTACAITEAMANLSGPAGERAGAAAKPDGDGLLSRWLARAARRTGAAATWHTEVRHGLLTTAVTAVVAMVIIRLTSGHTDGPVHAGQVCFAIGVGFWLGALVAGQFSHPALGIWVCLAVPVVALIGHGFAGLRPDLSGPMGRLYNEVVIIAPNALAKGLPINYLTFGPAAAILGVWTAQRVQRARAEASEA